MVLYTFQKISFIFLLILLEFSECLSTSIKVVNNTFSERQVHFRESINCNGIVENEEALLACGTVEYLGCTGSKKFYHESAIKMSWHEAWEYCRSIGLHLATIESRYEQSFIELFLPNTDTLKTETYWLSGNDFVIEGQFMWMATGRQFTYDNFGSGEPNNRFGSEDCVEMVILPGNKEYLWNDKNCLRKAYVLCQQDLRYPEKLFDFSVHSPDGSESNNHTQ